MLINTPVEKVVALTDDPQRLTLWYARGSASEADPGFPAEIGSVRRLTCKAA